MENFIIFSLFFELTFEFPNQCSFCHEVFLNCIEFYYEHCKH